MLLILAGVALATLTGQGNIIGNAENAVVKYNNSVAGEQQLLNEIEKYFEENLNYEVEEEGITLNITVSPKGITSKVIVTIEGKSEDGIKSYTSTSGESKTYEEGTKEITEKIEISKNGTYTITIENSKRKTVSKEIIISNILEGTIGMTLDKEMPTKDNVKVTIIWPSGSETGIKEIKVGEGEWETVTGETSEVEVEQNCTVEARVRNGEENVIASSITISNIDKNNPTVTVTTSGTETITEGTSNEIGKYFTYSSNGTAEITSVTYTDTSNEDAEVTNTNTLSIGTHIIKCTVTKATGLSASATKTIVVEPKDTTPPKLVIECSASNALYSNSVVRIKSIEDDVAMPENPIYSYYLKKATENDNEYKLKYRGPNTSYNPTNDMENYESYIMKVEVADAAGNIGTATIAVYGPACFVEGTQVLTESGLKNIEDIEIGEKVYAINIDTNKRELKEVTNVVESSSKEIYELTIGQEIIRATPKHKFYIVDKGWIMACELEEGDLIVAKNNNMRIDKIKLKNYSEPIKVYNLTVNDFHTYLITKYELLVHNLASEGGPGRTWDSEGNVEYDD